MKVEIVAILLTLFARLAEPVPVERDDLIGEDRTTPVDELAALNNIVNNVGKPRTIVKEQSVEDHKATEEKSPTTTILKNVETSKPSVKPTKFLKPYQTEIKATPSAEEKTESSIGLKNIKPSPSFVDVQKIVSPAKLKVDHESKKKSEASSESKTIVVSVNKISLSKKGGNEQGSEETGKEGISASTLDGRTKNYNKENAKENVPSDTLARRTVDNQVNNDEELDLAAEGTDSKDLGVISSKKVSQTTGNGDQETTQENLKKMPKVTVEKVTDKIEDKDKDKKGVQITVEKIKENGDDDGTEEEDLESDEKKNEFQERTMVNQREITVKESKAIPAQEATNVLGNDENEQEDEEKDLGMVGIRADENTRSTKDDESQTKVMSLDTTGKRPQTAIPKVTVIKVETKEKENESEEHKLTKTPPLKVVEVTKVEGEKLTTVDKDKGGANKTAKIKEPQKNVTVTVKVAPQEDITESKRDQMQEEALEEKQLEEEDLKKISHERSNAVAGNQPSVLSDEAKDAGMSNGEAIDKPQGNEDLVGSKKTEQSMTSEEKDLMRNDEENTEEQKLTDRRSEVIPKDTIPKDKEDENELELENEKEQEMQALKDSPDIKKITQEFDKALKKERSKSQATTKAPKLTASVQLNETVDAHQSSEKVLTKTQSPKEPNTQVTQQENDSKEKLSVEERELAQLAESAMSDDKEAITTNKKQEKPGQPSMVTENQTTAPTEPTKATESIVVKVEKLSKEEVPVPKYGSGGLSSKKEPPQKENKPKVTNVTAAPNIKPDDKKVQENPVVKNDDKETDRNSEKGNEDELEAEAK
ncbi:uncharacterized protein LOC141874933 [Acropora palmata]|uniref:uncharacterized protein LOC141874933 n=1 Tax=Acropora palmata TaxID=6131 RepID=UPI003D9FEE81